MKSKKFYKKQAMKDLKAQARISEYGRDKARIKRLQEFIKDNPQIVKEVKISIYIENAKEVKICKG